MVKRTLTAAAAVLVLLAAGCSPVDRSGGNAAAQARTLRFAVSGTDEVPEEGLAWAKEVEQSSGGTLKIDFVTEYAAGDPHGESRVIADIRSGAVDLGRAGARAFDVNGYSEFQPLLAPFLVDSYDLQARVFRQGIPIAEASDLDGIGVKPLGVFPGPFRRMMSRNAPYTSLSAYQGAHVAAAESNLAADVFAALGAQVAPVAGGQVDLSSVDAFENLPESVWGNQFQSTWRHLTANVNLGPRPWVFMANPDVFNSLARSQQDALTGAASNILDYALRVTADRDTEAMANLCAAGVTLDVATDAQLAELESAVRPVVDKLRADPAKDAQLDQIEALKFEIAAPPSTLSCDSPPGTESAESLGIPDGTYTRSFTVGDLRRYGAETRLKDIGIDITAFPDSAGQEVRLVFAGGLVTKYDHDPDTGEPEQESYTYTTYRGRIRLSGSVDIVASYTYTDGELRFSDFTFPNCDDCFGYEVAFGFVPQPWVKQE